MTPNPVRWVVNLRCYLLSLLRLHSPDCECLVAREKDGVEMRKRLEELGWRTQPRSLKGGDHGEVSSKPGEVVASASIPLKVQQRKKTA